MWEDVFYGVTEFHNCFIHFNMDNMPILRLETNFQKSSIFLSLLKISAEDMPAFKIFSLPSYSADVFPIPLLT